METNVALLAHFLSESEAKDRADRDDARKKYDEVA